jgi:hypothetical protein
VGAHPLKVLDVEDLNACVVGKSVENGVDVRRLDVSAHVLLHAQHSPVCLEVARVGAQHIAQPPHVLVLHNDTTQCPSPSSYNIE